MTSVLSPSCDGIQLRNVAASPYQWSDQCRSCDSCSEKFQRLLQHRMAEGGSSAGPPDLISDMVQPVDLVNSVTRCGSNNLGMMEVFVCRSIGRFADPPGQAGGCEPGPPDAGGHRGGPAGPPRRGRHRGRPDGRQVVLQGYRRLGGPLRWALTESASQASYLALKFDFFI